MTGQEIKSLGFDLSFQVPANVSEFDALAKRDGSCLSEAISNVMYRSVLAEFRSTFCEKLEALTENPRKTRISGKTKTGEDIEVYDETEADYLKRVAAEKGVETISFSALALEVAASIVFDPSATERKASGPKKIAKSYMEIVDSIVEQAGDEGIVTVAAKLSTVLGRAVVVDISTPEATAKSKETLAWAIRDDQQRKKKEVAASLLA